MPAISTTYPQTLPAPCLSHTRKRLVRALAGAARAAGAGVGLALVGTLLICLAIPVLCLLPVSGL